MIFKVGDMFQSGAEVLVVTTNAFVRKDGKLVMGRGAALQARNLFPDCAAEFGRQINEYTALFGPEPYGVLIHPRLTAPKLAIFQVKTHYRDVASTFLIQHSAMLLGRMVTHRWPSLRVVLNYPGIGNGGLPKWRVEPLIRKLPDNVEVWERKEHP